MISKCVGICAERTTSSGFSTLYDDGLCIDKTAGSQLKKPSRQKRLARGALGALDDDGALDVTSTNYNTMK